MTEMELKQFTPTERKILAVLADGELHPRKDFYELLDIVYVRKGDDGVIPTHISNMRDKLRPMGKWILSEYSDKVYHYRLVVLSKPVMSIS